MSKVLIEVNPEQINRAIDRLSIGDKIRLIRRLENQTWAQRLDEVVGPIRKRFRENPISDKEITRICEETRRRLYRERTARRH